MKLFFILPIITLLAFSGLTGENMPNVPESKSDATSAGKLEYPN